MSDPKCPGVKSPFGNHVFRRCTETCAEFQWAGEGIKPAMAWDSETKTRVCPNHKPRSVGEQF